MADQQHLDILRQGVAAWNAWRAQHPTIRPDFSGTTLHEMDLFDPRYNVNLKGANFSHTHFSGMNLGFADLREADFREASMGLGTVAHGSSHVMLASADLRGADLQKVFFMHVDLSSADLRGAKLSGAVLMQVDLREANLSGCNLQGAVFTSAQLDRADLSHADLTGARLRWTDLDQADLQQALLCDAQLYVSKLSFANLRGADLRGCRLAVVYDYDLNLEEAIQRDLIIYYGDSFTFPLTAQTCPITVDEFEVAQLLDYLLARPSLRKWITRIHSSLVLLVGVFSGERQQVGEALKEELRTRQYTPVTIAVENVGPQRLREVLAMLAPYVRFLLVDLTNAASFLQELVRLVPHLAPVPIQPLSQAGNNEESMPEEMKQYPWVLNTYYYMDGRDVLGSAVTQASLFDEVESMAKLFVRKE